MTNPEDSILDAIGALVDEQLAGGPVDDYNADRYDKCELCEDDWHGTALWMCPGAWATDEEKAIYREREKQTSSDFDLNWSTTVFSPAREYRNERSIGLFQQQQFSWDWDTPIRVSIRSNDDTVVWSGMVASTSDTVTFAVPEGPYTYTLVPEPDEDEPGV